MTTIAFLGLGAMGSRMAARLTAAGHDVVVWNRTAGRSANLSAQGAQVADSPKVAAQGAEIVISMVRDDEASQAVWLDPALGALAGMTPRSLGIEASTLSLGWVKTLSEAAKSCGVAFLDAPVAGSRPQAEAGQLIFLVGGSDVDLDRARPILSVMGGAIQHAGTTGAGAAVKLAVNALLAIQVSAIAELLEMLKKTGIDAGRAIEIISATPVASPAAKGAAASMLAGQFAPMFPIDLVEKDLDYLRRTAGSVTSELPMTEVAHGIMRRAVEAGLGPANITSVSQLFDPPSEKRFGLFRAAL